uniref:LAGLIDADG endonuclease n=1 Tax=Coniothyrium glycines TaxID=1077358 RepID=A0A3G4S6W9_9PLEO|nr:LAGLIDADG endonuclease [Coniothyrium glycines]AYU74378.1 LAGLIDADG endonuclease [Coniothyrium glycines]
MKLTPWWVTGITDSEGNFSINYSKPTNKVTFNFKITQKDHSLVILTDLQAYFGIGNINIDNKLFNTYKFSVNKIDHLINIIIPHFDKYPLKGSKQLDFLDWKKAILDYAENKSIKTVLTIKEKMNRNRSFEDRWNYLNLIEIDLKPEWIQAFVNGEGCFQCGIGTHKNRDKDLLNITHTLEIAQNTHDIKLLVAIKDYFNKGYLKPKFDVSSLKEAKGVRSVSRFVTYANDAIISFFDKYPMYTRKQLDFVDWKKLVELKKNSSHKTEEGLMVMKDIKKGMNAGRLYNNNLFTKKDIMKIIKNPFCSSDKKHYSTIRRLFIKPFTSTRGKYYKERKFSLKNIAGITFLITAMITHILYISILLGGVNLEELYNDTELDNYYVEPYIDQLELERECFLVNNNCVKEDLCDYCTYEDTNGMLYEGDKEYIMLEVCYDPFKNLYTQPDYSNLNASAFEGNSNLSYSIEHLGDHRLIIFNNAIFGPEFMQAIKDIAEDIQITEVNGNSVTNLTIDSNVANLYFTTDNLITGSSLDSNLTEVRLAAELQYENEIRQIRTAPVFSSPEFSEFLGQTFSSGSISIIEVSPSNSPVDYIDLEERHRMRMNWRDRIQILFSNKNPGMEPLPMWSEVPPRPSEPWALEQWERDNHMRTYWAERLNGGYIQTNIVIRDSA